MTTRRDFLQILGIGGLTAAVHNVDASGTIEKKLIVPEIDLTERVFNYYTSKTIRKDVNFDFTITTPATLDTVFFIHLTTSQDAELCCFRDTTIGYGGTTRTAKTALTTVKENPTIIADGNLFISKYFGAWYTGIMGGFVLANNSDYLVRISSLAEENTINMGVAVVEGKIYDNTTRFSTDSWHWGE